MENFENGEIPFDNPYRNSYLPDFLFFWHSAGMGRKWRRREEMRCPLTVLRDFLNALRKLSWTLSSEISISSTPRRNAFFGFFQEFSGIIEGGVNRLNFEPRFTFRSTEARLAEFWTAVHFCGVSGSIERNFRRCRNIDRGTRFVQRVAQMRLWNELFSAENNWEPTSQCL